MKKFLIAALLFLLLTGCATEKPPEPETHPAYNVIYDDTAIVTRTDEFLIEMERTDGEKIYFLAVPTPFEIGKEFSATILGDGYVRIYDGETYVGTYEVKEPFNADLGQGEIKSI